MDFTVPADCGGKMRERIKTCLLTGMSVPTDNNNKSLKEYNEISKYKHLKLEMWHLKPTTMSLIVENSGMNKKGTNKLINKTPGSPSQYEIQKKCTLWNWSFPQGSFLNVSEKYHPKEVAKKKNT